MDIPVVVGMLMLKVVGFCSTIDNINLWLNDELIADVTRRRG